MSKRNNKYFVFPEYHGQKVVTIFNGEFVDYTLSEDMTDAQIQKMVRQNIPTRYFGETEIGKKLPLASIAANSHKTARAVASKSRVKFEVGELTRKAETAAPAAKVDAKTAKALQAFKLMQAGVTQKEIKMVSDAKTSDDLEGKNIKKTAAALGVEANAEAVFLAFNA